MGVVVRCERCLGVFRMRVDCGDGKRKKPTCPECIRVDRARSAAQRQEQENGAHLRAIVSGG